MADMCPGCWTRVPAVVNSLLAPSGGGPGSVSRRRQREVERAARPGTAFRPDPSAMGVDDAARDRQAEAGPMVGRLLAAPRALEQRRQLVGLDTGAGVAHEEHDLGVACVGRPTGGAV